MGFRVFIASLVWVLSCGFLAAESKTCAALLPSFVRSDQQLEQEFSSTINEMVDGWNHPMPTAAFHSAKPPMFKIFARISPSISFGQKKEVEFWQREILSKLVWQPTDWNISQSTKNSLAILVASWNSKVSVFNLRALVAYSFLHPLVDGPLDRGEIPAATLDRIQQRTRGEVVLATSPFEKDLFYLLDILQETFPPAQHPILSWLFKELFKAQLKSIEVQHSKSSSEEDLFLSSLKKGGLCLALSTYLAQGYLTHKEFIFLVKEGALLQLFDDLGDVIQDRAEGVRTLFTEDFGAHNSAQVLQRLISLQIRVAREAPVELSRFSQISILGLWFYLGRMARFEPDEIESARALMSQVSLSARWVFSTSYYLHRRKFERNLPRLLTESQRLPSEYFREVRSAHE